MNEMSAPSAIMRLVPFELSEYERAFVEFLHDTVQNVARAGDPILSQIRVEKETTTAASRIQSREGINLDLPEPKVGFEIWTSLEAVRSADYDQFAAEVHKAAGQLRGDLARGMFESIDEITKATGNVVDAQGELTFGKLYELMEKLEWSLRRGGALNPESGARPSHRGKAPSARDAGDTPSGGRAEGSEVRGGPCSKTQ